MTKFIPRARARILLASGLVGVLAAGSTVTAEAADPNKTYPRPFPRPVATYISRLDIERQLYDQLRPRNRRDDGSDEDRCRTIVVGKSQLVLNYIQTHGHHYQVIFWIEARHEETIIRDYTQIYRTRLNPTSNENVHKIRIRDAVSTAKFWLENQEKRSLVVMDNLNDIGCDSKRPNIDLRFYLPSSPQVDRIITTRNWTGVEDTDAEIRVGVMSESESVQLFKHHAKLQQTSSEGEKEIRAIVRELEYLPLAVNLAGSCVAGDSRMATDPHQYLHRYRAQYERRLNDDSIKRFHQYRKSTLCALEVSLAAITHQSQIASRILELLAFLDFDDILPDLFDSSKALEFSLEPQEASENALWRKSLSLPDTTIDGRAIKSAFKLFKSYSLATQLPGCTTYTMNEMAYTWVTERLDLSQKQKWNPIALELLKQVSKLGQYNMDIAVRTTPHILVAFKTYRDTLGSERSVTEGEQASLVISHSLLGLSGWRKSEQIDHFIHDVTKKAFGLEHPYTLETMFMLATALSNHHHYDQAEDLYRKTLELRKRVLGPKHEDTISTMVFLAKIFTYPDKHEVAEELHKNALVLMKEQGIPDREVFFDCMKYLCFALCDGKKYEEANETMDTLLKLKTEFLGPDHPEVLSSMRDSAIIANTQGQHARAEAVVRELLGLQKKTYDLYHPEILLNLKLLGRILADQSINERKGDEYSDLYSQALLLDEPENPERLRIMAWCYEFSGLKWKKEYEYAEIVGRYLLLELQDLVGPVARLTLLVKAYEGDIFRRHGKYAAAEKMIKEAFNTSKERFGLEDDITLECLHRLDSILYEQGKHREGHAISRLHHQVMQRVKGAQSLSTIVSMGCLAETLEARGEYEQALSLFRRMQGPLKELKGPDHPHTLQAHSAELRIREKMAKMARREKRPNPEVGVDKKD